MSRSRNDPPLHLRNGSHNSSPGGASGSSDTPTSTRNNQSSTWGTSSSNNISFGGTPPPVSSTIRDTGYDTVSSTTTHYPTSSTVGNGPPRIGLGTGLGTGTGLGAGMSTRPGIAFISPPIVGTSGLLTGPAQTPPPSTRTPPSSAGVNLVTSRTAPPRVRGISGISGTSGRSDQTFPESSTGFNFSTVQPLTSSRAQFRFPSANQTDGGRNTGPPQFQSTMRNIFDLAPSPSSSDPVQSLTPGMVNLSINSRSTPRSPVGGRGRNTPRCVPVLADTEQEKLRELSRLIGQLHADTGQCRRIQRGSPGAGTLSGSMTPARRQFNQLKPAIQEILCGHDQSPGITRLSAQFNQFDNVLSENINERGYDDGYTDRVRYLEKMNYECGQLKGMVDAILEGILVTGGQEEETAAIARNLTFTEEEVTIPLDNELQQLLNNGGGSQRGEINIDITLTTTLCSNLFQFRERNSNTDVTFRVGRERAHAHRVVLAAQSDYFNSLLLGSMKEAEPNSEIDLEDVSMATLKLLITFAYCGRVQLMGTTLEGVLDLLEAADRFSFINLKDALISQLSSLISNSTVAQLLVSAYNLNLTGLQDTCLKVAEDNAMKLIHSDSLMSLPLDILTMLLSRDTFFVPEMDILEVVERWKNENSPSGSQLAPLLKCVRLPLLPIHRLVEFDESEASGPNGDQLFTDREVLSAIKTQTKLCWERMNPRGVKATKNLFALKNCAQVVNTVMWSSDRPYGHEYGGINVGVQYQGRPDVPLCDAIIASKVMSVNQAIGMPGIGLGTLLPVSVSSSTSQHKLEVEIKMDKVYLVNCIILDPYPNDRSSSGCGFSYILEVSLTGSEWRPLVDFSKYTCYGRQQIPLPVIGLSYLRFKLCSLSNTSSVPFTMTFTECSFKTGTEVGSCVIKHKIPAFPSSFTRCLFTQEWSQDEHSDHTCCVKLHTPVSANTIRIKMSGTCAPNAVGDVVVEVNKDGEISETIQNVLLNGSEESNGLVRVSLLEDTVISSLTLKVINVVEVQAANTAVTYTVSCLELKSDSG